VYCSSETHSATEKDAKVAGIGRANVRKVPIDTRFAMRADRLNAMIREDLAVGATPICVVASLGTTGVGAMDPLRAIGEVCRRHNVFLHVDAAWAGSALILPHHRPLLDGIEHVDSFVFNPHKWLFTNFDCSAHFVRDPQALIRTFAINPAFLMSRAGSQVTDYRDWSVQLGRRFRALKLWFVIRTYGVAGLRRMIAQHIVLAEEVERYVVNSADFELMAPRSLALINFRYHPRGVDDPGTLDKLNSRLLEALNDSGRLYLTQNLVKGAYAIRLSIGQTTTERRHVEAAWQRIQTTARAL
jgi:aromatic-L-amino-acid decarboxylase